MGTKKIKWHEAREIGRKISNKAFEHLTAPLEVKRNAVAGLCYQAVLDNIGCPAGVLKAAGFAEETNMVQIDLTNNYGNQTTISYSVSEDRARIIRPSGYHAELKLSHDELYDKYMDVEVLLNPLEQKRDALMSELQSQVEGKTATQAMKNWPEAADIIADVLQLGSPAMTVPLEQLLARFLPALPAPKE